MNNGKKDILVKEQLKKDLKKEFWTSALPGIIMLCVTAALIFLEVLIFDRILFTIFMSFVIIVGFIAVVKDFYISTRNYIMVSSDKFTVITDKLYRIGVGENNYYRGRRQQPPKEVDNNESHDVYHFCTYGRFIPKIKDIKASFSGDEFYLVILKNNKKTILKAYNSNFYKFID